jgi:rod shape determining protein RodA
MIGILMLYSSTGGSPPIHRAQLVWLIPGTLAFLVAAALPCRFYESVSLPAYFVSLVLLVAVLLLGVGKGGEHRWFDLGPMRFQPSEFAKLALIFGLASLMCTRRRSGTGLSSLSIPLAMVLTPAALVLVEPDLGTAVLLCLVLAPMLFWAGTEPKYLVLLALPILSIIMSFHWVAWALFIVAAALYLYNVRALLADKLVVLGLCVFMGQISSVLWRALKPYQKERILAFISPETDPLGAGYQIVQSKIALGSGGFTGKGFMMGTQKGLEFLPEKHTDFIFSVLGEELGFIGCMSVLFLFTIVFLRALKIARESRNPFASLASVGIVSMLGFQVIINVAVSAGLVPVTGMTLPFISYGGSSLVTYMAAVGILVGFSMRKGEY